MFIYTSEVKLRLQEQKSWGWLRCQVFISHHMQSCKNLPQQFTAATALSARTLQPACWKSLRKTAFQKAFPAWTSCLSDSCSWLTWGHWDSVSWYGLGFISFNIAQVEELPKLQKWQEYLPRNCNSPAESLNWGIKWACTFPLEGLSHCAAWNMRPQRPCRRESGFSLADDVLSILLEAHTSWVCTTLSPQHHKHGHLEISYTSMYRILDFPLEGISGCTWAILSVVPVAHLDPSKRLHICWLRQWSEHSYSSSRYLCVGCKSDPGRTADYKEISLV